jgi:hypothetical protein
MNKYLRFEFLTKEEFDNFPQKNKEFEINLLLESHLRGFKSAEEKMEYWKGKDSAIFNFYKEEYNWRIATIRRIIKETKINPECFNSYLIII